MKRRIRLLGMLVAVACILGNKASPLKQTTAPLLEGHTRAQHEASGKAFVITSSGEGASVAGQQMYAQGGNIYDAFAAVSFAISVERPQSTGLGGGGFAMIFDPAHKPEVVAMDFRERAPLAASEGMFLDAKGEVIPDRSTSTIFAVATPGLVAGVTQIHAERGKLPLSKVLEPAIKLAAKGFRVYPHLAEAIRVMSEELAAHPASRAIFLRPDGTPLGVGDLLVQEDLAETLRAIARDGAGAFYRGSIRDKILAESQRLGGLLSKEDFESYNVRMREPVARGTYGSYEVLSMPPSSSGGAHLIQILNIVEPLKLRKYGPHHPTSVHYTAAAMQRAFADRATFLGDSDFVKVPLRGLTSKSYAASLASSIPADRATPSDEVKAGAPLKHEPSDTTHFSIADKSGAMIASTQTINGLMGSGIVAAGTGIVLNNEMDDFSARPGSANMFGAIGGHANKIDPGKRPLSSMSPTLVLHKGKPFMTLGTPAGTRILTCVASVLLNSLEYKMSLYDAIATVRYHHQWQPDEIRVDEPGLPPETTEKLKSMGYKVVTKNLDCKVNAVQYQANGTLLGVADPRSEGRVTAD